MIRQWITERMNPLQRRVYAFADRWHRNYDRVLARELELTWLPPPRHSPSTQIIKNPVRPLRILYLVRRYVDAKPRRGVGYSEYNFFASLVNMGHAMMRLSFETRARPRRQAINSMLRDAVTMYRPDVLFTIARDDLDMDVIRDISTHTETVTLAWFVDDDWRFESHSQYWAPLFNWVVTNAKSALPRYDAIGCCNVIHQYFAWNHFLARKGEGAPRYDVSFVGSAHGIRGEIIRDLRRHGIDVATWGSGWRNGRLSLLEMIRVFQQSKINLNLSAASVSGVNEVKGRDFEIPGHRGFMITGAPKDEISECYRIGEEIEHYESVTELVDKIRYYLEQEEERAAIAHAGHRRTLEDHTYAKRFNDIFRTIGFSDQ